MTVPVKPPSRMLRSAPFHRSADRRRSTRRRPLRRDLTESGRRSPRCAGGHDQVGDQLVPQGRDHLLVDPRRMSFAVADQQHAVASRFPVRNLRYRPPGHLVVTGDPVERRPFVAWFSPGALPTAGPRNAGRRSDRSARSEITSEEVRGHHRDHQGGVLDDGDFATTPAFLSSCLVSGVVTPTGTGSWPG